MTAPTADGPTGHGPGGPGAPAAGSHRPGPYDRGPALHAMALHARVAPAAAPGLGEGIGIACAGAVGTALLGFALGGLVPTVWLARVTVGAVLLGYGAWLTAYAARPGRARSGTLVWALAGLATAGTAGALTPGVGALAAALLVWLAALRAWLYAPTPAQALRATAWLAGGALAALGTGVHTGSAALAVWVFLLAQAPFGLGARRAVPQDAFARARHAAHDALRRAGLEG